MKKLNLTVKPRNDFNGAKSIISLRNVYKTYQMGEVKVHALRGVSLDIMQGDFVAIIGASGSGKSTLMNLVGCLDIPTKGEIFLKGQNITHLSESRLSSLRGRTVGFIFQQYNLIPNLSAFQNVLFPLELQEFNDSLAKKRARELLQLVGLSTKLNNLPSQMSGGEQQRTSIARSLAADPEVILADEPTGALDSVTGREVIEMLQKLWKNDGKTVIMVTHDLKLARYAHRHVELKDGEIIRTENNINMIQVKNGGNKK
ncbi:ABC transporter ATP-binding protein [Candidatus Woesearchaeota archaeon]|nr:ABC transporter ATP-binding protein [Candidatus Woesearchaeota archaeon]